MVVVVSLITLLVYFKRDDMFQFLSEASGQPADLVVNADVPIGELPRPWVHLAQGGEELSANMFAPVLSQTKSLAPETIRIDHLYDGYDVVSRNESGQLTFNWTRLDEVVSTIRQTGAVPMLSLSYMPPAISSGDIIDQPKDWSEWALVVQQTIEHYSGTLGIPGVSYEVWNEPDLFGGWKTYGQKNYLNLYQWAVTGASRAQNVQPFKIGGPATTAPYDNWIDNLATFVEKNNLRMDFISWHRYSKDVDTYKKDFILVEKGLQRHPALSATVERYVTEWGPDSDNDRSNDSDLGAAHLVAVVRANLGLVHRLYTFELVDGKNPEGQEYWGRWGLLTHPSVGNKTKPRYGAIQFLNKLSTNWLNTSGEGSWVQTIATKTNAGTIQVIVVNYDQFGSHTEQTPLSVEGLTPGGYKVSKTLLGGGTTTDIFDIPPDGIWSTILNLSANNVVLIELTPEVQ